MNTKTISLISSVIILALSGVGYYYVQQKNNFPVSVPQDITMMASTTTDTVSVGEPSIRVDSFKSDAPGSITISYSNLPKRTSALTLCLESGGCSEWVGHFVPESPNGKYVIKFDKPGNLGPGRLKVVVIGDQFSDWIAQSNTFEVLQNYTDENSHYSISYPADDFEFADDISKDAPRNNRTSSYMGNCPRSTEIGIREVGESGLCYVGSEKADGFSIAFLDFYVSTSTTKSDCEKTYVVDSKNNYQSIEDINGITFYKFLSGDAGLGHRRNIEYYKTYHNDKCYKIGLVIDSSVDSTGKELSKDFSESIRNKMHTILETFKFTD